MEPPIQISAADWKEVQRILANETPALEVWAFGSRARRTAKPLSAKHFANWFSTTG